MRKRQKRAAMFARVDKWEKSGKSMREYAAEIGITKSCFGYWVRKRYASLEQSPAFVELTPANASICDESAPGFSNFQDSDAQAQIVITFPSGMCVKIYG
jgi:hypothetical protein